MLRTEPDSLSENVGKIRISIHEHRRRLFVSLIILYHDLSKISISDLNFFMVFFCAQGIDKGRQECYTFFHTLYEACRSMRDWGRIALWRISL